MQSQSKPTSGLSPGEAGEFMVPEGWEVAMELVSVAVGSVDRVERVECTVERRRLRRDDALPRRLEELAYAVAFFLVAYYNEKL